MRDYCIKAISILSFMLIASCDHPGYSNAWWNEQLSFNKVITMASELQAEHDLMLMYNLEKAAHNEPDIDTFTHEVYSFEYSPPFSPHCIVRAEQLQDSSCQLTSKCLVHRPVFFRRLPAHAFKWVRNYLFRSDSSMLYTEVQKLDRNDWDSFRSLLVKSEYWTFETGPGSGSTDNSSLTLCSKSIWPNHLSNGTLFFHYNLILNPEDGAPYKAAYNYLAKKSMLYTKYGFLWMEITE